ncbi:hypothetical protein WDW37_12160 [Bdellovibrionota bacterium FG-1]
MLANDRPSLFSWQQLIRLILLARGMKWAAAYAAWMLVFRLLVLTFITYFLISSSHPPKYEDISEALNANELSLLGLGALIFIGFIRALFPITSTTPQDIFTPARIEKRFIPGFVHGSLLAAGITLAYLLSGSYRYLGFFIQFEEAPFAALTVLVRIIALGAFAYFEEFLFRSRITQDLQNQFKGQDGGPLGLNTHLLIHGIIAVIYCAIKWIQFDLGVMQLITLFLISIALSTRTLLDQGDFGRAAGFWAGILIVFHPLLSLPVLGNDFSGLILIKYQGTEPVDPLTRLMTGGAGGPLSSVAFQIILALEVFRGILKYKKRLSHSGSNPLKS